MRSLALVAVVALGLLGLAVPDAARGGEMPVKVAIIVGPVGEELTPVYIGLAEAAAEAATARGATVARAYSPDATPANVLAAVENANIVIYLGHGIGTPNPYSATPEPASVNGWGLQGPNARGTHADSYADGTLAYYGEAWIAANARPAPGWVMIYSNACYAPGAGEGFDAPATPEQAASRVAGYSRGPLADLGASAYFATDYFQGAAHLVTALLDNRQAPYGHIFASEPNFVAEAVARGAHPGVEAAEVWLHRSAYFEGRVDYWYAFAGNPDATFAGSTVPGAGAAAAAAGTPLPVTQPAAPPLLATDGTAVGSASHYPDTAGWEGLPTVALPADIGGGIPDVEPHTVLVCADRCVALPVVDSCPCYVGTADQRVANLSHAAWHLVTDRPLSDGLVDVKVYLSPVAEPTAPQQAS